jgi:hypothetical protein
VTTARGRTPRASQTSPPSSPRDISPVRQSRLTTPRAHKSPRTPKKYSKTICVQFCTGTLLILVLFDSIFV